MRIVIRKVAGVWIVQCSESQQIYFTHKNMMTAYKKLLQIKYDNGRIII